MQQAVFQSILLTAVLGGYYVFYVSQQTSYLTTRNFRLLATIGEHIDAAIETQLAVQTTNKGTPTVTTRMPSSPSAG